MPRKVKPKAMSKKSNANPSADPVALQAGFGLAMFAFIRPLFGALCDKGIFTREESERITQKAMVDLQLQQEAGAPEELYKCARFYLETLAFASEVTRGLHQNPEATNGEQT